MSFTRSGRSNGINIVLALVFCTLMSTAAPAITKADDGSETQLRTSKPNVVLVITDDQGYGDLSCHGNPVLKTPNLDELYTQSVRLTDYHVSPTCSPTRAALLTGHWTNRTGVWHTIMGRSLLRENELCVADVFKSNDYATGMFGKWHLGDNYPFRPEDRGFAEVLRHGGGGVGQTPDYWDNAYFDDTYWHNGEPTACEGYCTDVFFDYAKQFIKTQKEAGKPFFAYISTNAPHGPMLCPDKFSEPYSDQSGRVGFFLGMIANIDHNVGELRKFLAEEGLAENTIFIFTTDNGTAAGDRIFNADMRGNKGSEFDGGHRVPFMMHWPARGLVTGRDATELTAHVDIMPTLIDLCELQPPADVTFDGTSIQPVLTGEFDEDWPDRMLVTDSQRRKDPKKWRKCAVMKSGWRLINGKQLYDMNSDPGQQTDVAAENPEIVKEMKEFYDNWWAELEPTFAESALIYIGHDAENPARLTSHDWITSGGSPWNQATIRKAENGIGNTGFWNVKIAETGTYEISLRRWPASADLPINSELAAGEDVPGEEPFRVTPGKAIAAVKARISIAGQEMTSDVPADAKQVTFSLDLEAQDAELECRFVEEDGTEYGAYYVYVLRK